MSATSTYDKTTWNYQEGGDFSGKTGAATSAPAGKTNPETAAHPIPAAPPALPPNVAYDLTLQHPRCVFQLMKQQYSRYTPETVERITGIPKDQYLKAVDLFTSVRKDGDMKKVATIIYAVGWTQHTFGTQIIRTAAMIQLLLGNVGRAGGGVNALRGHSNIQGATDMAGLYDSLPGYLESAGSRRCGFGHLSEADYADIVQALALGFDELLREHAEIHGVVAQGVSMATRRRKRTDLPSITCPNLTAIIRGPTSGTTCTTARSRA